MFISRDEAVLAQIKKAVDLLQAGGLVALPTETVYGLAADASNEQAVARIFAAKGRPAFNPLIVHVPSVDAAKRLAFFGPLEEALAAHFWPGPLTMVVPVNAQAGLSPLVTAGLSTVALRVPGHPIMREVLTLSGLGLAAPSANRSGRISPTTAQHVRDDLGGAVDFIIDGGETSEGLESTIVKVNEADNIVHVLRPGTVTIAALQAVVDEWDDRALNIGLPNNEESRGNEECEGVRAVQVLSSFEVAGESGRKSDDVAARPIAPGQLLKHYAPKARVRLGATDLNEGEGLLDFGAEDFTAGWKPAAYYNLSEAGDLREAARRLYAGLHYLDGLNIEVIAVRPLPTRGVGAAINDRLQRAAAGSGRDCED